MLNIAFIFMKSCVIIRLFIICNIVIVHSIQDRSWHIFNNTARTSSSSSSSSHHKPYTSSFAQTIRDAWNIPSHNIYSPSYQELQFDRAMDIIYQHQHPKDCMKAKYLVSEGYNSGFGSEIHVDGFGLALAMEQGRVYMPYRHRHTWKEKAWQTPASICGDDTSLSCYFEPWSHCTYEHVDELAKSQPKIRNYRYTNEEKEYGRMHTKLPSSAIDRMKDEVVTRTILPAEFEFHRVIPHQLSHLIDDRIPSTWRYYWWRAISAAYLIRPNIRTQHYIHRLSVSSSSSSSSSLSSSPSSPSYNLSSCVGMYVRHGDKGREMKLQSFATFAHTAAMMWNDTMSSSSSPSSSSKKTIFFGTETPQVVEDALAWGKQHGWNIIYNPLQHDIFDKTNNIIIEKYHHHRHLEYDRNNDSRLLSHSKHHPHNQHHQHHIRSEYEFLSMIVNLADLMRCDVYVCTLMSNYCRLLDEMRAMVAAKPHALFADLSYETCSQPPCIGPEHIISFDW